MTRPIQWLLVLLLATGYLYAQQPATAASATVLALEREWAVAQAHNDNRALDLLMDNFVVYVEYGRLVSKGEYLSRIKRQDSNDDQVSFAPMTIRSFGNTAIVTGTYVERRRENGRLTIAHWRFLDTWLYKQGGWVLIAAAATPIQKYATPD